MEKLKELIGEELFKQVVAKLPSDKKYFFAEGENFVPKSRLDEEIAKTKDYKQQLTDRDNQLKELADKAKGHDELAKKISELETANKTQKEEYEKKISAREREYLLDSTLATVGVKNAKAVKALLDHDKIVVKDGSISGLTEQIEALKKSDAYLFNESQPTPPSKGGKDITPPGTGGSGDFADFIKM